ncbi:MAG: PIG-L family deacetylase, partial [bacterium]
MNTKTVLAVGAHPDDIEFMMAGTLALLKEKGYEIHLLTIANGSCGTCKLSKEKIIKIRKKESENAAKILEGIYHPGLVNDLEIFYEKKLLAKVGAIIREIKPEIVLSPSPEDYMEDHQNTSRLITTALFCRGMKNFTTSPPQKPYMEDVYLYHALPYGLKDGLKNLIIADEYVDISSVMEIKEKMLREHKSQKEWLDASQGLDSYLKIMKDMSNQVAKMSKTKWQYAEGWRKHLHLGFSKKDENKLKII